MATLTIKSASLADAQANLVGAGGGGDKALNEAGLAFLVVNTDATAKTITLVSQVTNSPGVTKADVVVTVGAAAAALLPVGGDARFTDGQGYANLTYSAVTALKVSALRLA